MTDMPTSTPLTQKHDELHERVEALLDTPVPREGDSWPVPVDEAVRDVSAPGYEPAADKPAA